MLRIRCDSAPVIIRTFTHPIISENKSGQPVLLVFPGTRSCTSRSFAEERSNSRQFNEISTATSSARNCTQKIRILQLAFSLNMPTSTRRHQPRPWRHRQASPAPEARRPSRIGSTEMIVPRTGSAPFAYENTRAQMLHTQEAECRVPRVCRKRGPSAMLIGP